MLKNEAKTAGGRTIFDKIRQNLLYAICMFVVPIVSLSIYFKVAGWDFATTEIGELIMIGVVLGSIFMFYLFYTFLFEKYAGDLPPL